MSTHLHTHTHTYTHMFTHLHTHTYIEANTTGSCRQGSPGRSHIHTRTYIPHTCSLTYTHLHRSKHDWFLQAGLTWKNIRIYIHTYTNTCSLTYTHTHIYTRTYTHTCSLTHTHLHQNKHDWFLQAGLTWKKSTMRLNVGRLDASGLQHSSISSLNCRAYSTCKHICEVRVYVCVCVCGGGGGMCMCVHACVHARTHFGGLTKCVWEI